MLRPPMGSRLDDLLNTLGDQAQTLVRNPRSTVEPPRDLEEGARALAQLKALAGQVEPFVDEGPLGRGGMGVVRLATQVSLNRKVAVKSLRPDRANEEHIEALVAEAWRTGRLEHPNILPVYSLRLLANGQPELVMKRIEGRSWADDLREHPVFVEGALQREALSRHLVVLGHVCHALHFAHARGLVHRDVKPENVMLGAFGEVYLVDWGIATAPGPARSLAGTPAYAAPEMLGGDGAEVSVQTDVYLLGAALFEVLTGRPPHLKGTSAEMVSSIVLSQPMLPTTVPSELADLVRQCMQAEASKRLASAEEVRLALEAFAAHQGSLQLTAEAKVTLEVLRAATRAPAPDVEAVASAFSACRFGFQQALREWHGNLEARDGLTEAVELMVRFELARGSGRAAQVHLAALDVTPPSLAAEVAKAVAEEQARQSRLQSLEFALDPRTDSRPRFLAASILGAVWVVMPLLGTTAVRAAPHLEGVMSAPMALISGLVLFALRLRFHASLTPLNRQLSAAIAFAWLFQGVGLAAYFLSTGQALLNVAPMVMGYWGFVTGLLAVTMLPQAWAMPLAYFVAMVLALRFPEARFLWQTLANLVVLVTMLTLWRRSRR